ncbi:phage N-6-adenine-methyltransferase (plasmid) [Mycobacterium sp. SMC-2]|nr:phage N-6-adenine-methyltransferase [Mycobacterium sp. SMC-2]UXA09698.1 phage N-6-adenine-methyltransferase [Mycobacterium sp. SMC-2]
MAARGGADDAIDDRATTPEDFARFDKSLGPFTLDVAAAAHNAKCARYFIHSDNGLAQSWAGERVWCNPPYSRIGHWVEKAWREHERTDGVAMLLPANRTEQGWWQQMVEPYRDRPGSPLSVLFLPGRMRFIAPGRAAIGPNERPPFGCCLVTWRLDSSSLAWTQQDQLNFEAPI